MARMREGKIRTQKRALGAFLLLAALTVAVLAGISIAGTKSGPALPGVYVDAPPTTKYCLGSEPPYWICFDL